MEVGPCPDCLTCTPSSPTAGARNSSDQVWRTRNIEDPRSLEQLRLCKSELRGNRPWILGRGREFVTPVRRKMVRLRQPPEVGSALGAGSGPSWAFFERLPSAGDGGDGLEGLWLLGSSLLGAPRALEGCAEGRLRPSSRVNAHAQCSEGENGSSGCRVLRRGFGML